MNMREYFEQHAERHIGDLRPGESGWTVPWAMAVRSDGWAAVCSDYFVEDASHGTVAMRVTRNKDGVDVEVSRGERWNLLKIIPRYYDLPVLSIQEYE